ncbi:Hypothetical protein RY67_981 [Bifidobacterium longum subsp. infantis]|uniref:Uncharacterized protein n=1 Tax=Bifidobacterium longum subsp. infantis TaxID=1682 RepID=A0A0M3T655_BIFLI|nr:Hypothetical protein RY67_981 [Bifidobacterium longum subsp. infantis]
MRPVYLGSFFCCGFSLRQPRRSYLAAFIDFLINPSAIGLNMLPLTHFSINGNKFQQ